ncbi:MAG: hypothetical protein APF76_09335 [Desulfitibacter sp. BRH_c19]|nr:MAG: hypothetical protein APF76_09335 [Desulfitibacter sp. BRH_c19]
MEIIYTLVKFQDLELKPRAAEKIRGFFAKEYEDSELLHNHKGDQVIYKYPRVQYKIIKGITMLCGIEEGASLVANIGLDTELMILDGKPLHTFQREIINGKRNFGLIDYYIEYKFVTPWLALNQKNNKTYDDASDMEKEEVLKRIIVGNIISLAKGLGYTIEKQIYTWINLKQCPVMFKNIKMRGFIGTFKVNFMIPDYLGIGKSVSRGFGTIIRS